MEKHFCNCPATECPNHPLNQNGGCDPCIKKILELGEVPACVWFNAQTGTVGKTEWSMENFSKFYLKHIGQG